MAVAAAAHHPQARRAAEDDDVRQVRRAAAAADGGDAAGAAAVARPHVEAKRAEEDAVGDGGERRAAWAATRGGGGHRAVDEDRAAVRRQVDLRQRRGDPRLVDGEITTTHSAKLGLIHHLAARAPCELQPAHAHLQGLQIFDLQCTRVELNRRPDDVHRAQLPDRALAPHRPQSEHALHLHVAGVGLQRDVVQQLGLPERARQLERRRRARTCRATARSLGPKRPRARTTFRRPCSQGGGGR